MAHTQSMEHPLLAVSSQLAELVAAASPAVVAISAGRNSISGVLWKENLVLTSASALEGQPEFQVLDENGAVSTAHTALADATTDVAILQLDTALNLERIREGEAQSAGELLLVVGRSPDSGPGAALGILSAKSGEWKTWQGGKLPQYLRIDARLYPGSRGGAVINARGELLGIATAALSRIAGLILPLSHIDKLWSEAQKYGGKRGWLGVGLQEIPAPAGSIILSVEPNSPAAQAGLLVGDVITHLGDDPTPEPSAVMGHLSPAAVGTTVAARIVRAGERIERSVTVGARS
jgi:S1-C subfamily serine protease